MVGVVSSVSKLSFIRVGSVSFGKHVIVKLIIEMSSGVRYMPLLEAIRPIELSISREIVVVAPSWFWSEMVLESQVVMLREDRISCLMVLSE